MTDQMQAPMRSTHPASDLWKTERAFGVLARESAKNECQDKLKMDEYLTKVGRLSQP